MNNFKAVIFDMDGLMIDSEPLHLIAYNQVLKQFDFVLSEQENNARYIGVGDVFISNDLVSRLNLPITPEELLMQKAAVYFELLTEKVKAQPGLIDLVKRLHQLNLILAIGSGSALKEIQQVVNTLKIAEYFSYLCSSEDFEHAKPAPDIYLHIADKLNIAPKDCLVLEDSPSGLQAAKSAGMSCYVVPSRETLGKDFSSADAVLADLTQVFN